MTQERKVRAIDTETIGEPSFFNKKDKSKIDFRGHPRLFKAKLISDSLGGEGRLFDAPFSDFKINEDEIVVFHNATFDLHVLVATEKINLKEIYNDFL